MKRKTKEKIWSIFIAIIFLTSMVMFGLTFSNGNNTSTKTIKLKGIYNRALTKDEYVFALSKYKTIIEFEHPTNCCQSTVYFLKELPNYSSGNVIYCDINSNETSFKMESYNGVKNLNQTEILNNTLILKNLCDLIVIKNKIPECVLIS